MYEAVKQANKLIDQANQILVVTAKNPNGDAVASALGLCIALLKLGKSAQVMAQGSPNEKLSFLPSYDRIGGTYGTTGKLQISIDIKKCPVSAVAYAVDESTNRLVLTLDTGAEVFEDSTIQTEFIPGAVDLLITVGVSALEQLGDLQEKESRLIYDTPLISIDNNPDNTQFGQVHVHKLTSASLAELVFALLIAREEDIEPGKSDDKKQSHVITEDAATALLAGIVGATRNFESARTTPDCFHAASVLLERGADQQTIIKHLYRTKSIALLKLWGRALGKLTNKPELGVIYTSLAPDDFSASDATTKDIAGVVDEIAGSVKNGNLTLLLWQTEQGRRIRGILYNGQDVLRALADPLGGVLKNGKLVFRVQYRNLEQAEEHVFDLLKELL